MTSPLFRLREVLAGMESVLGAFSGGVDSAVVLAVAHEVLGPRAVGFTAVSPTLPAGELSVAKEVVKALGVEHVLVDSHELEVEGYRRNDGSRCYFCKSELFALAERTRRDRGLHTVADGTLLDDLTGHRPGLKAATEWSVRHPLVEAGLGKQAVRDLARALGLRVWDKPSFACLGSRFSPGTAVTLERVRQVDRAETALRSMGFRQVRVRWHHAEGGGTLARVEVPPDDIGRVVAEAVRQEIDRVCREAGFRWVTVDLRGYRPPERSAPSG